MNRITAIRSQCARIASTALSNSARTCTTEAGRSGSVPATRSSFRTLAKATLIGRLGREPELHTFESGQRSLRLSVATNVWEKVNEEFEERTQWHRVFVRDGVPGFDFITNLSKGTLLYIEGAIRIVNRDSFDGRLQYCNVVVAPADGTVRVLSSRDELRETDDDDTHHIDPF